MERSTGTVMAFGRLLLLGLVSTLFQSSIAQIGVDLCACSPSVYEFTLDFSLTCPPVNITRGDAIAATTCLVSPFGDPAVTDLIPVSVQTIDILELNQNLQIIVQENIAGSYGDGDTFQYTSISAIPGQITNPVDIPRAIQLNIIGVNQFDEPIINVYLITFTNDCGFSPVLFEGQSAGWTIFSDLEPPRDELCPQGGTQAPTKAPVTAPTDAPSDAPSFAPSSPNKIPEPILPTMSPSFSPTGMSMDYMTDDMMSMSMGMNGEFGQGKGGKGKGGKSKGGKGKGGKGKGDMGKGDMGKGDMGKGSKTSMKDSMEHDDPESEAMGGKHNRRIRL